MPETAAIKIAKLETQMLNNQTQLNRVEASVAKVEDKVDKLLERFETTASSFLTKKDLTDAKNEIEDEFNGKINDARRFNWATHTASAVVGAFIVAVAFFMISALVKSHQ